MMTEQEARRKFALYFLDLQADARAAGATVNKAQEWMTSILVWMDEGRVPETAIRWKCPRSLRACI